MKNLTKAVAATSVALGLALPALVSAQNALTLAMQLEPPILDPTSGAAAAIDEVVYANLFEGLTRFQADGSVAPALATSWTISDDGTLYTFKLAEGVTFHDGAAFTADDVKFSLERARAEDSSNAQKALFTNIEEVTILSASEVAVSLAQPDGAFITKMAWGDAVILDEASAADAATNPIGTGPFKFDSWARGSKITLKRNPDYWGEQASLDSAEFLFISDPNAAFAAIMSGQVQAFPGYPAPETLLQFQMDPRFALLEGTTEGETILAMNHRRETLADVRVRKAISHAINRQDIIDGAMFGFGTPIGTHFAPHHPDYVDLTSQSAYDPDMAKALLKEAGYESGLTLTLKLPPPSYARRGGEIIASQLRAVGIETEISNLEWGQWLEQVFRGHDFDLTIVSHTEPMDINIYARPEYYFGYDNAEFQQLMSDLEVEQDPAARSAILVEAQSIIADDYVNGFLFQLAKTGVADKNLQGLWKNAPTQANDLTGVSWR